MKLNLSTTLDLKPTGRAQLFLSLAAGFILISRYLTISGRLPSGESVAFALALHRYDLAAGHPPLPGYPVYIFCAKLFSFFGFSDAAALVLPGILSAACAVYPLYHLVKRLHGDQDAVLAVLLYTFNPGLWILALTPGYHALMLFPFLLALRMFLRIVLLPPSLGQHSRFISLYAGTVSLGLLAGISLDAAFLFLPLLVVSVYGLIKLKRPKIILEMGNGLIVGLCLWAIPFFFSVPLTDLIMRPDAAALPAHFNTAVPVLIRLKLFLWNILAFGFLGDAPVYIKAVPVLAMAAALGLAVRHIRFQFRYFFLLIFFVLFGLYSLLFKSPYAPAHTILFLPLLLVFLSAGASTLPWRRFVVLALILVVSSAGFSVRRALVFRKAYSPQAAMAASVDGPVLFCGISHALVHYTYPERRAYGIQNVNELEKPIYRKIRKDKETWLTSEVPGITALKPAPLLLQSFDPECYLFGRSDTLRLYRVFSPDSATR